MTITQHLEFSVLTAPLACVDRRSLSQAWYSALYGTAQAPVLEKKPLQKNAAPRLRVRTANVNAQNPNPPAVRSQKAPSAEFTAAKRQMPPPERRAPRSPLARKIERAFLQPKAPVRKAAFTLESAAGRVQILLSSSGARIGLIAICPQKARKEVAAALAQARYALAARGIEMTADVREMAAC